jgi:hypothetical protein
MDKKKYFKSLVTLFEAPSVEEVEMASTDPNNPDYGANVDGTADQALPQASSGSSPNTSDTSAKSDLGDADYLSTGGEDGQSNLPPIGDSIEVSEPKKMAKLFDLFKDLLNYSTVFFESLTTIDMSLLDADKVAKLRNNIDQVNNVNIKLREYITETFPTEKYEKALYVYILLRTELMTIIKLLRESLELNAVSGQESDKKDQK